MKTHANQDAVIAEFKFLQNAFGNKSAVADAFGLHRSTVGRWHKGLRPDLENEMKITALRLVLLKLQTLYRSETAEKWLLGVNAYLHDQRPLDFIKQGRFAEVLSAIEQTEAGGYA